MREVPIPLVIYLEDLLIMIHHKLGDHDNLPPIKEKENESLGLKSIESRRWYRRNIKWYNIKILFDVIPTSNGSC